MYEQAIAKVQQYRDTYLPEMHSVYPKYEFDTRSYARWAANEIIDRLIEEDSRLPPYITGRDAPTVVEIINGFIGELEYYFDISGDQRRQEMFNVAENTAKYILHIFL